MGTVHSSPRHGKYLFGFGDEKEMGGFTSNGIFMHLYGDDPYFATVTVSAGETNDSHRPMMSLSVELPSAPGLTIVLECHTLEAKLMHEVKRMVGDILEPMSMKVSAPCGPYHRPDKDRLAKHVVAEALQRMSLSDLMQFMILITNACHDSGKESMKQEFRQLLEARFK